jgi:hypothetical protein
MIPFRLSPSDEQVHVFVIADYHSVLQLGAPGFPLFGSASDGAISLRCEHTITVWRDA